MNLLDHIASDALNLIVQDEPQCAGKINDVMS